MLSKIFLVKRDFPIYILFLLCNYPLMQLGTVIRKWRLMEERTIRDVAKEIGTSSATLLRVEQGNPCDSATMQRLLNWLLAEK